jgi:hypothetical protein
MAATAQQQLDAANDSLLRILQTDTSSWSESGRAQQQIRISELNDLIEKLETKVAQAAGRRIFSPVRRVDL